MQVNILLFPGIVPLDLVGPYEVLARVRGWNVDVVAESMDAVPSDKSISMLPTADWKTAPAPDVFVIPGGSGVDALLTDNAWVAYVAQQARQADYLLGVCTGTLLLGAAGLLHGRLATSHWMVRDLLPGFGATVSEERVVRDGDLFTAAGVSAGLDAALRIVGDLVSVDEAQSIQLMMEYDPIPPFRGGTVATTPSDVVKSVRAASSEKRRRREALVKEAVRRMPQPPASNEVLSGEFRS